MKKRDLLHRLMASEERTMRRLKEQSEALGAFHRINEKLITRVSDLELKLKAKGIITDE